MHPVNRIALWLGLTAMLPWLEQALLYAVTAIVILVAAVFARVRLARALLRSRWLLLALAGVYGWTTPGEYLWPGVLAPTHEGLVLGLAQAARLLAIVASLQLLLTNMPRPAIFAGLYVLLRPLEWLGLSRDRLALRLTLTLEMMENLLETRHSLRHLLLELHRSPDSHAPRTVLVPVRVLTAPQRVLLLLQLAGIAWMLWIGGFGAWA